MASARAIATRCCCRRRAGPGCLSPCRRGPPARAAPAPRRLRARRDPVRYGPSMTLPSAVMCGNRLNCWNTMPIWRGCGSPRVELQPAGGLPGDAERLAVEVMRPSVGSSRRLMQRSSVLLPEPLAPISTTTSPRRTARSMPRSTSWSPNRLWMASRLRTGSDPSRAHSAGIPRFSSRRARSVSGVRTTT